MVALIQNPQFASLTPSLKDVLYLIGYNAKERKEFIMSRMTLEGLFFRAGFAFGWAGLTRFCTATRVVLHVSRLFLLFLLAGAAAAAIQLLEARWAGLLRATRWAT